MNYLEVLRNSIEHTNLKPDALLSDIEKLCEEAMQLNFPAVCVSPYFLDDALAILADTDIEVATVIGFPFGYSNTIAKFEEADEALRRGAHHLDVVVNIAAIKNNDWETVENEIETITKLVHKEKRIIKIIAETGLLNEIEMELLCKIANVQNIDFMKTSTGIIAEGATIESVKFLRTQLNPSIKIKASGGIKTKEQAIELMLAGATRIGTSSGVAMMI